MGRAIEQICCDELQFVFLDDSINCEDGVVTIRLDVAEINIDAKGIQWEIRPKYETETVCSLEMEIPR